MKRSDVTELCEELERCLISPNVADSNFEPANLVDVIHHVGAGLDRIAKSIDGLSEAVLTVANIRVDVVLSDISRSKDKSS